MYYVYVLRSEKDDNFYVGYTSDLRSRLRLHGEGKIDATKVRRPLKLVYYEACLSQEDALHREKYLKSSYGKRYIKNRLKGYLTETKKWSTVVTSAGIISRGRRRGS